jgi:hypothetical protein
MHDCPVCHEVCDCDGEDHVNFAASNECDHACEPDDDDLGCDEDDSSPIQCVMRNGVLTEVTEEKK